MKYLCLVYGAGGNGAFEDELRRAGKLVAAADLEPARTATTVRVRELQTQVSDGPYAETPEPLAGYLVLDCHDMDEALALAAQIPAAEHGGVEVRPEYVEGAAP